jgi:hypothetical protein
MRLRRPSMTLFSTVTLVGIELLCLALAGLFLWLGIKYRSAGCFAFASIALGGLSLAVHVIGILHPSFSLHYVEWLSGAAMMGAFLQTAFVLQENAY